MVFVYAYGTLINSSSSFNYAFSGVPNAIILGFSLAGTRMFTAASVLKEQFYGMVDELRVYSRELNASDVYALAILNELFSLFFVCVSNT
jgi:hypothetical protein